MKLYITYFVTMENAPEISNVSVFTNRDNARKEYDRLVGLEHEWMEDLDEDDSDWAEARMETIEVGELNLYDSVAVVVETEWLEAVETTIKVFTHRTDAISKALHYIDERKAQLLEQDPHLIPFNEYETFEESMHLYNDSVMVDYEFEIFAFTID